MITNINHAKQFFDLVKPMLQPPYQGILDQWRQSLEKFKKNQNIHCIHLETPRNMPFIFKAAELDKRYKGTNKLYPVLEGHQCFCSGKKCNIPYHQKSKLIAGSIAISLYAIEPESQNILKRIMEKKKEPALRIHFDHRDEFEEECICDLKNPTSLKEIQAGSLFHLQFGGSLMESYSLDVPRVPSFPMDWILLTDIILRNFYSKKESEKILEDNTWKSWKKESFEELILPYAKSLNQDIFFS